ncbi:MAG: ABC transporter ATP-binding protein [Clostridiales bacterium GWF2_38_85]|nr:MAG: ABC transporter ATP-binding protein [Clostridiales bacterium GWF2_38_85]HBL84240.1 ABC transporter ATP-binding protein [Clostridiales bacterium]
MNILNIEKISKSFGKNKVINDLSFSVPENSIFGFIGQNGAGKTTTMKMVLGLLKADSGKITVLGEPVVYGQTKTNKYIGYLPDVPEFYSYMTPKEYLKLCGDITGMDDKTIKIKSDELISLVGLDKANKRIGGFSRGMKQRLGIAQALLNEPQLLICDEPTSALDPKGRKEILDILSTVKGKTTVVFSTHILSDVERICDRVAVLHSGKLALAGTLPEIKAQHKNDSLIVEFAVLEELECFKAIINGCSLIKAVEELNKGIILHTYNILEAEAVVLSLLSKNNLLPLKLEVAEPTLENLFMEITA